MQPTFSQLKSKAKESLKSRWPAAVAITAVLLSIGLLDVILEYILMSVFRVDAVWTVIDPTTLPHYSIVASFCITVFSAVYGLFLSVPFFMGALRWFWKISHGEQADLQTVFYYFSSARLFFKTVFLAFLLLLFVILGALVCFIPSIMISLLTKPEFYALFGLGMPIWTSGLFSLAQTFEIVGLFLFICWIARYSLFFVPLFENEQMSAMKIISESVKLTKGKLIRMVGFAFSFIGWLLLCIFLLPALFVIPFALSSLIEYAKEEQKFKAQAPNFFTGI